MFNDILFETKGFKYQITVKNLAKKYKGTETKFTPVYFNSTTKIVINHKFGVDKSFQGILYRIDSWINEGSGWIIKWIESQYINISTFRLVIGSYRIKLPAELKSLKKRLTNIKNIDQKLFSLVSC